MNFYRIHEFIIRPPEALSCSVESTAFFSFFFLFPPLLRSFLRAWRINLIITHALYKKKTPFSSFPSFISLWRSCFLHPLPACTLLRVNSCLIIREVRYCFSVQMCFLCRDLSQGECVCVFFFFLWAVPPPNFFGIYVV